jgi:nitrite reductase/ring-hydroxylating ferredoxin subunit
MALVKAGTISQIPPQSVREVCVGEKVYAVCNLGGEITALDGLCLHRGGPLGHGQVSDGRVVCPWHLWEFDCRTGEYDYDPSLKLATYRVQMDGDEILIEVPETSA